jgi:hypothetical protein
MASVDQIVEETRYLPREYVGIVQFKTGSQVKKARIRLEKGYF